VNVSSESSPPWQTASAIARVQDLLRSYRLLTGRDLLAVSGDEVAVARQVFEASVAILSHGTEADPLLDYGNRGALAVFGYEWTDFVGMPSRLTAEAPNREERQRLLDAVTRDGYIADYAGIRISRSGRRFRIEDAVVWTVSDAQGRRSGQAAAIGRWRPVDP
jgi:hypothetical protein